MLYDSIYRKCPEQAIYGDIKETSVCQELGAAKVREGWRK